MTKIMNMTPHAITFVQEGGNIVIEPSGTVARVAAKTVQTGEIINGIPVTRTEFGEVEDLPAPEEGTVFIVSSMVAGRVPDRTDVFIPNESVRDDAGRIIGCKSFGRI